MKRFGVGFEERRGDEVSFQFSGQQIFARLLGSFSGPRKRCARPEER
jgi:hypothetical protein